MARIQRVRIALAIPYSGREFYEAIIRYALGCPGWDLYVVPNWNHDLGEFPEWDGAGGIFMTDDPEVCEKLARTNKVIANIASVEDDAILPAVMPDDEAVGEIAARYYIERGHRTLAYVGETDSPYARRRLRGFLRAAEAAGAAPPVIAPPNPMSTFEEAQAMAEWLANLPKPLAVFAPTDGTARALLRVCRNRNVNVPEEIALLGVDDEWVICNTAPVPLSSIDRNAPAIGHAAAELLDRLLNGAEPPRRPILIPPVGVVERQSTQTMSVTNPDVARAMRVIRETFADPDLTIERIAQSCGVSARSLQMLFRDYLGCSPREHLIDVRIDRAKQLLAQTDMPLHKIAQVIGLGSDAYLCRLFKKVTGQTPNAYRKTNAVK